jgi:hypothetical protein
MNIRNTISAVIVDKILEERNVTGVSPTGEELHRLAMAAIFAGQRDGNGAITPEWRTYMTFLLTGRGGGVVNQDDLRRLVPDEEEAAASVERQRERAYLVGNGMCGAGTGDAILIVGDPTAFLDQ